MAIVTKDDLLQRIKALTGEDTSDETLSLFEDFSDTFTDLESKTTDTEDWKSKYEENDKMWRKKYADRFSAPVKKTDEENDDNSNDNDNDAEPEKELTFENLFTTEGK